jgi:hypothetical protein
MLLLSSEDIVRDIETERVEGRGRGSKLSGSKRNIGESYEGDEQG